MSQTENPQGTLRTRFPLKKIKILKKTIGSLVGLIILSIVIIIALAGTMGVGGAILGIFLFLILAAIVFVYQWFYFKNYFYDLTENGLVIRKGVIGSWSITLPPHKVQDVYLDQDLLDRIFGLHDLHLSTATDVSNREAHIDGLSREDAKELRAILLEWISGHRATEQVKVLETLRPQKSGLMLLLASGLLGVIIFSLFLGPFGIITIIIFSPIVLVLTYLDFSVMRYELREDSVFVRTGYILPKESMLLYRNIQDVEEKQGLFERIFGVHTLIVKTMTASSVSMANLLYLSSDDAKRIRKIILEKKSVVLKEEAKAEEAEVITEPGEEIKRPFANHFFKDAHYSVAYSLVWSLALALVIGVFALFASSLQIGLLVLLIFPGLFIVSAFGIYISAIVSSIAYSYSVFQDRIRITFDFISIRKREIPFRKVQDIEKHVSFSSSFAKLAHIKLETGSKELLQSGKNQTIGSRSVAVERLPSLNDEDAEKLKQMIAERIGISLDKLEHNPLVSRFPLEKIKPLKKTLWWAIYIVIIFVVAIPLAFVSSATGVLLPLAFLSMIVLAAKYIYELEYLKKYHYTMNDDVLLIKKGVFGYREISVPLMKIQDVFIQRDMLDLVFGLYDVYISTATSRSIMNAHIDGVNSKNAQEIALLLVDKIAKKK
jgi:membrane protein YdbS with pleckstrin-like domain